MSKITIDRSNLTMDDAREIIRLANIFYFRQKKYEQTHWMGVSAAKCPMDMWVYQEILHSLDTDLLVETGTLFGGSALFFAHMFDILGKGKVITVDLVSQPNLPQHPRITYLEGSSTDHVILAQIEKEVEKAKSVTVILDSDHKADYKYKEMQLYSKFVSKGNYMIAEDTCFDYYPAWPEFGPGPMAAVQKFIDGNTDFEIDRAKELHMMTFAPMAFLKKK